MMTVNPEKRERFPWEDTPTIYRAEEELTRAYGDHTLAFFGLAPENEHFLAPGGRGLVNYRLMDKVAVVLGDPLCAPEAREQVTRSFLDFCASRHWSAAFYQASSEPLATYRALKLGRLKIGEEAIIDPQHFTLNGSALANVRTSCRRAEREGVRLHWYEGAPPAEVIQQLEQVSAAWLRHKAGEQAAEMGFSMGRLDDLVGAAERAERLTVISAPPDVSQRTIPRLVTAVATEDSGVVCAFVTFTPIYGTLPGETDTTDDQCEMQGWGWTLDLMRRVPDAPPGVMELLLVRSIERFRADGARRVSLGMVAWADSRRETHPVQHQLINFITDRLGLLASRQTLSSFKQKFQPDWQSRYLVVSSPLAWPRTIRAILRLRNYQRKFGNLMSTGWQFLRYCLVGGVNTLLDLLILNILLWSFPTTNIYVLVAYNSIAYTSGSVSSFLFNKYWTFRHKQKTTLREVGRFALILLLEVLSSNGLVWLAGQALRPILSYGANPELWGNASKLVAVAVGAVLSYLCMRFWIFATGPQDRSRR